MPHASDCATHNMPAHENQHCDCGSDLRENVALKDKIADLHAALEAVLSVRMLDNLTEAQWALIRSARGQQ